MKITDIKGDWPTVMVRCNAPDDEDDTILVGFFSYINGEISSLDGDIYSIEDEYESYEISEDDEGPLLVLTFNAKWEK